MTELIGLMVVIMVMISQKAKQDFDKVLNGGNLSKTFERNDER